MDYSTKISTQVAAVPRSGIRDFFELVQGREDVISLGVGEPDFATPWHIREAAIYSSGSIDTHSNCVTQMPRPPLTLIPPPLERETPPLGDSRTDRVGEVVGVLLIGTL